MLDHITLSAGDYAKSRAFYEAALAPLGYRIQMSFDGFCGFGDNRKPYFWLKQADQPSRPMHIAFAASDRKSVDGFYRAALAAGGRDNGPPGLRPDYHPNYYAAFVFDLDGHPIEAVCHRPAPAKKSAKPKSKAKAR